MTVQRIAVQQVAKEVERLFRAFPAVKITEETAAIYIEMLARKCLYAGALNEAVERLILGSRFLPSIAEIYEEYLRHRDKYLPPALPEPAQTEEERLRMVSEARQMIDRISSAHELDEGSTPHEEPPA